MEIICGIYKITNLTNNKVYIGQSTNILKRFIAHKSRAFNPKNSQYESPLYRAIRKYGIDNFDFKIIEECKKENLNKKEQHYIKFYQANSSEYGYNLTEGGSSPTSYKLQEEEIEQIYDLLQNSTLSEDQIGKRFNVDQRTISYINCRQVWSKDNFVYPLRKIKCPLHKNSEENQIILPKEEKFCKNCGKEITRYSKTGLCSECYIKSTQVNKPTKEELFEQLKINKGNFLLMGRIYNVSNTAVRKWCKYYNLPFHSKDYK